METLVAARGRIAAHRRTRLLSWFLMLAIGIPASPNLAFAGGKHPTASKSKPPPLEAIIDVRTLTASQAADLVPVRLTGLVTDLSGYKNSFFVQDKTGSISVDRSDQADVHDGDLVEITGTTGPGSFAPIILASKVKVLGRGQPPSVRHVTFADMYGGALDSDWIEVDGVIHSAHREKNFKQDVLDIELQMGSDSISVLLQDFSPEDLTHLIDATVRIRGVCTTNFNDKRQFIGVQLVVPHRADLQVLLPAEIDPFKAPSKSVREALQFGQSSHRIKVTGTATYHLPGHTLYLQDGDDGIRVQIDSTEVVEPGKVVEAVGFPAAGEYAPILEHGAFRVLNQFAPIKPRPVAAAEVMVHKDLFDYVPYDQQLIEVQGTVQESFIQKGRLVWLLKQGGQVFEADLPLSATVHLKELGPGSVVQLTGICAVHVDMDRSPASFGLLLRTPADIVILKRAPWWTTAHALAVLMLTAGSMVLAMLWVLVLRSRVEKQTRIIRESEERFRHLAEHDFLTGLPNRLMLESQISQSLAQCIATGQMAVVLTIDIDRFKRINDTYGHLIGDECLKTVAARLHGVVRKQDVIARTGGEEFTLVVGNLPSHETAQRIAASIIELFRSRVILQSHEVDLTVSAGAAMFPSDSENSTTLRRLSDQALYAAKNSGRNKAVFYSDSLCAESLGKDSAHRDAISHDEECSNTSFVAGPTIQAKNVLITS